MKTEYIKINEALPLEPQLKRAAETISFGGLVAFPTETVYGLGASALDAGAAAKIYAAKGRPSDNPLIVHISSPEEAEKYCVTSPKYRALAERFMPGPLTVIMQKREIIPKTVTGGLDTVAIRCPKNEVARRLIRLAGVPIAAPSANISGSPSPTNADHVRADLDGKVDMIIDGGECEIGLESTIIKLDGNSATLLRPGAITPEMLKETVPNFDIDVGVTERYDAERAPLAPGMKYKHYAPRAQVYLVIGGDDEIAEYIQERIYEEPSVGVICFNEIAEKLTGNNIVAFGKRNDENSHAKALFAALRRLDSVGASKIYATAVKPEGLDLATYNRMLKASGYTLIDLNLL